MLSQKGKLRTEIAGILLFIALGTRLDGQPATYVPNKEFKSNPLHRYKTGEICGFGDKGFRTCKKTKDHQKAPYYIAKFE